MTFQTEKQLVLDYYMLDLFYKIRSCRPEFRADLPPRRWLGNNFDPVFLGKRIARLQNFTNQVNSQARPHNLGREQRNLFLYNLNQTYGNCKGRKTIEFSLFSLLDVYLFHRDQYSDFTLSIMTSYLFHIAQNELNLI